MYMAIGFITFAVLALAFGIATIYLERRKPRFILTWSDEFDGKAGSGPDQSKWTCEVGGHGWGNSELQMYTDRPDNAFQDGKSNLVIRAQKETLTGADGTTRDYTSARLITKGKFAQSYGRFEARIRVPYGQGLWPAFWMMGDNIDKVGWPECGEIDVMENIGKEPGTAHGSLHGPGYWGGESFTGALILWERRKLSADFHEFAIEWDPTKIDFYLDGKLYYSKPASEIQAAGKRWVFDRPFFILLNVAVGGSWPGSPDATTVFPQEMLVDYVRVYRRA